VKLVVLTMRLFDQPRSGGELCTARLLQGLVQAGHEVVVIGRGSGPRQHSPRLRYISLGDFVPAFDDMPLPQRLGMPLAALAVGRPVTTQRLHGIGTARLVQKHLAALADHLDALVVDHLQPLDWIANALDSLPPPMVVMHNLEADGYAERAEAIPGGDLRNRSRRWFLQREALLLRELEVLALRRASVIACLSEPDAERLRDLALACGAQPPVVVLPGYALGSQAAAGAAAAGGARHAPQLVATATATADPALALLHQVPRGARRIGLIGTWTWEPNRAGLQWMLAQVQPHLPADCHLVLAGTGLEGMAVPPRTVVLGRLAEVGSFYASVDIVAIPSVRGSGVHEKAIEAIGSGLSIVATLHALRGLLPDVPQNVHVAPDARAFAQACARVSAGTVGAAAGQASAWTARRREHYRAALRHCLGMASAHLPV